MNRVQKPSLTALILAALAGTHEKRTLSTSEIWTKVGVHRSSRRVSTIIGQLMMAGKIQRLPNVRPARYYLYRPPKDKKVSGDFAVAGKITIGRGAVWGAGLA